jgi:hypothetical protein
VPRSVLYGYPNLDEEPPHAEQSAGWQGLLCGLHNEAVNVRLPSIAPLFTRRGGTMLFAWIALLLWCAALFTKVNIVPVTGYLAPIPHQVDGWVLALGACLDNGQILVARGARVRFLAYA